jgi:hypothetical protein
MRRYIVKAGNFGFQRLFRHVSLFALVLLFVTIHTINISAQKLPPILKEGATDPSAFNLDDIRKIKREYDCKVKSTDAEDREAARQLRNRLIGIGRDQVDAMFINELRNDRKRNRLIQFVLDFLEIGAATAISLTNGERAKTAISEGLGALQATRTSLNKNFQLLERQILINKMEADRATILAGILSQRDRNVTQYSWEDARADLRLYRNAGTLDSAWPSLSSSVGKEKTDAVERLREITDKPLTGAATEQDLAIARDAFDVETKLESDLSDANKRTAVLSTLQRIVGALAKDEKIAELLENKNISATTDDGMKIIIALDDIKESATILNRRDLVRKINAVIIEVGVQ